MSAVVVEGAVAGEEGALAAAGAGGISGGRRRRRGRGGEGFEEEGELDGTERMVVRIVSKRGVAATGGNTVEGAACGRKPGGTPDHIGKERAGSVGARSAKGVAEAGDELGCNISGLTAIIAVGAVGSLCELSCLYGGIGATGATLNDGEHAVTFPRLSRQRARTTA